MASNKNDVDEHIKKSYIGRLIPITTICDQATGNCRALKQLFEDTQRLYISRDEEYRGNFFEMNGRKFTNF